MCGIYGMVSLSEQPLRHPERLASMGARLRHRGPDGEGTLEDRHAAVGARRLRIVDRRPAGDQPFEDGTRWLVCNGEIYNAGALRARYSRYPYRSRSDVEPLLPLIARSGPAAFDAVDGMFAAALWDRRRGALWLARDRAGEKPLYYLRDGDEIWFASEIQALLVHPRLDRGLDDAALLEYLGLGYVREPRTMYRGIRKVPAGTTLAFHASRVEAYARPIAPAPAPAPPVERAEHVLEGLVETAVAKQCRADVPVGVFTSGGVDSSLIASLAARRATGPLHTFAVRFDDRTYDEGAFAARLARAIDSRHIEVVADEDALAHALDEVASRLAEPLADPAILPTYLLARAAREHVGVVLSGEGADELFGGYPTYAGHRLAAHVRTLPGGLRHRAAGALRRRAASTRRMPLALLAYRFLRDAGREWLPRHLAWFGTGLFRVMDPDSQHRLIGVLDPAGGHDDGADAAMAFDYRTYLREGLLVKLDRATMLHSLEARAPYLDGAVTTFARRLAERDARLVRSKRVLKRVAARHVPTPLVRRLKRGLSVPVARWLDRGLRSEVDRLADPAGIRAWGVLSDLPIEHLVSEHRRGLENHGRALWTLLILQRWNDHWGPGVRR